MLPEAKVIIVGSGLAGLAAADVLSSANLQVLMIDENQRPGGQLLRSVLQGGRAKTRSKDPVQRRGLEILARLGSKPVKTLLSAQVVGLDKHGVLWVDREPEGVQELRAEAILLATGAREKFLPFPGWTLPGVLSTGGAQLLIKGSGVLPAQEMVIAGCGVLPPVLALEVLKNKGRVRALLTESNFFDALDVIRLLPGQLSRIFQGGTTYGRLLRAGLLSRKRFRILKAFGNQELQGLLTVKIDAAGTPVPGTERVINTTSLAIGHGFIPNIELAQAAGCLLSYDSDKAGWVVQVSEHLETSQENIFAAGEPIGIGGGQKSLLEGTVAGLSILTRLQDSNRQKVQNQLRRLQHLRQKELRFGAFLNRLNQLSGAGFASIPPETIICRCEQVPLSAVLQAMAQGFDTLPAVKKATRCAKGLCQGRVCGPILQELLATHQKGDPGALPPLAVRPPVKPVQLSSLLDQVPEDD